MDTNALLERKKQFILRVLKGAPEIVPGAVVQSEVVGEVQQGRRKQAVVTPGSVREGRSGPAPVTRSKNQAS